MTVDWETMYTHVLFQMDTGILITFKVDANQTIIHM